MEIMQPSSSLLRKRPSSNQIEPPNKKRFTDPPIPRRQTPIVSPFSAAGIASSFKAPAPKAAPRKPAQAPPRPRVQTPLAKRPIIPARVVRPTAPRPKIAPVVPGLSRPRPAVPQRAPARPKAPIRTAPSKLTGLNALVAQPPPRSVASRGMMARRPVIVPRTGGGVAIIRGRMPVGRPRPGGYPPGARPARRPNPYSDLDEATADDLDFIDDDEVEDDGWKRELRDLTGYDPSSFSHADDEEALETDMYRQSKEEFLSELVAKKEDRDEAMRLRALGEEEEED